MRRSTRGLRSILAVAAALIVLLAPSGAPRPIKAADPVVAEPALAAWDGGVDLYRKGVFTTQKSWLWCTAAGVQIVRNVVDHQQDHTTSGQRRYFNWMRGHNRYTLPLSAGIDPQGWTAGLRHFVDDRYRLVVSSTFDNAVRSAVKRLRQTNLPVALTVSHGNHGWILTGFTATADPATTASFRVTSVRVVGPLYGLQSRNGYDMPPDTKLTPTELKRFLTPWRYVPKRMVWDGKYVTIQPVPVVAEAARATPATAATAAESSAAPVASTTGPVLAAVALATQPLGEPASPEPGDGAARPHSITPLAVIGLLAAAGAALLALMARCARESAATRHPGMRAARALR